MTYFDVNLDLTDEDRAIKEAAHKFAKEVMRPVSIEIDKMSAEEVGGARVTHMGLSQAGL